MHIRNIDVRITESRLQWLHQMTRTGVRTIEGSHNEG